MLARKPCWNVLNSLGAPEDRQKPGKKTIFSSDSRPYRARQCVSGGRGRTAGDAKGGWGRCMRAGEGMSDGP